MSCSLSKLIISKVLTNKLPFYQYKNTQIYSVMMRKETPQWPEETDGEDSESSKELDEKVWVLLVRCWDYDPPSRPNCEAIQEALKDIGFQDTRPEATTEIETGSSFWQAMREKSGNKVDYERVANILLPVSSRLSIHLLGKANVFHIFSSIHRNMLNRIQDRTPDLFHNLFLFRAVLVSYLLCFVGPPQHHFFYIVIGHRTIRSVHE